MPHYSYTLPLLTPTQTTLKGCQNATVFYCYFCLMIYNLNIGSFYASMYLPTWAEKVTIEYYYDAI